MTTSGPVPQSHQGPETMSDPADIAAFSVLKDGGEILAALTGAGISLRSPSSLLAFQILAVLVAKSLGADPRRNYENILTLVDGMNLAPLETWIKDTLK